jgi:predicted adenine nucleotide alpha hydrolase (AANH) superfamily ATPase
MSSKNTIDVKGRASGAGKPALLAHICCGPDAIYAVALLQADHEVTGVFYNPNIDPREEYDRRLGEVLKVERILGFTLIAGDYDRPRWEKAVRAFRDEPERGRRCDVCAALRLDRTARLAREAGISAFTTIMSVSPRKKADAINRIGRRIGAKYGLRFLESDFKKKGGFQKSVELSRRYGLYRQSDCGCAFARRSSTGAPR